MQMKFNKFTKSNSSNFFKFCLVLIIVCSACSAKLKVANLPACNMKVANMRQYKISGGQTNAPTWDTECDKSVTADFDARDKMEEFKSCKAVNSWGPQPNVYPEVDSKIIPEKCNLITWQQKRVLALIDKFTKKVGIIATIIVPHG